jgi:hypothetical protein
MFHAKKNKFLNSRQQQPSPSIEESVAPPKSNSFLTRAQAPQTPQAQTQGQPQAQTQGQTQGQLQGQPQVDFPALSKGPAAPASIIPTVATTTAYKSALLSNIDVMHAEEQARIQRAVRRDAERNEERRRQLELAARRERFVNAAMNRVNGMAYNDDDVIDVDTADNDDT